MSTAADDELRVLRARAYGPNADIESDPVALARLRHLEEQRQGRPSILEIPSGWMGAGPSSAVFDFFGLALVQTSAGYINGSTGTDCLTVVRADQVPKKGEYDSSSGWSSNGPVYAACGVGVFPATVEVPINSDVPKELSERFPAGRALQFVFDGERVGVFLDSE